MPVLVHGSEGTDSTLLVTALAQLLLDSDARTVSGSCVIEFDQSKSKIRKIEYRNPRFFFGITLIRPMESVSCDELDPDHCTDPRLPIPDRARVDHGRPSLFPALCPLGICHRIRHRTGNNNHFFTRFFCDLFFKSRRFFMFIFQHESPVFLCFLDCVWQVVIR